MLTGKKIIYYLLQFFIVLLLSFCSKGIGKKSFWEIGRIRYSRNMQRSLSLKELSDMKVNLINVQGGGYHLGDTLKSQDINALKREVDRISNYGMKGVASVSAVRVFKKGMGQESIKHVLKNEDGSPMLWQDRENEYVANLLDPYWRKIHKRELRKLAEVGIALIHVDNPLFIAGYDDSFTQQAWQKYIAKVVGLEEKENLKELLETQLETKFAESFGGDIPFTTEALQQTQNPFIKTHFNKFRYHQVLDFLREIREDARKVNSKIAFDCTGHVGDKDLFYWTYGTNALDVLCIENATSQSLWFEPEGESWLSIDLAYSASGGKPMWIINKLMASMDEPAWYGGRRYSLYRYNPSKDRQELYMASAISKGTMLETRVLQPGHANNLGKEVIKYDELIGNYYRFAEEYESFFTTQEKVTDLALVISSLSWLYDPMVKRSFFGVGEILLKKHFPFDILIAELLSLEDLSKYKTIIAVDLKVLSKKIGNLLSDFTEGKGHLIVSGDFGTMDTNFTRRSQPLKTQLFPKNANKRITYLPFQGYDLYQKFSDTIHNSKQADMLITSIGQSSSSPITITGKGAPFVVAELREGRDSYYLHILNYNFNLLAPDAPEKEKLSKEKVIPTDDLKITVRLDMLNSTIKEAIAYSVGETPKELRIESEKGQIILDPGRLDIFKIIKLTKE
jgi:hypothetical protein